VPELTEAARVNREVFLKTLVPRARRSLWVASRMAEEMDDVDARAGDVVYEADTPAEHYYFVVDGVVEMVRDGAPPWAVTGPGLVGVLDVALARPHSRKAVAKTDARILRLPAQVWFDALEDSFDMTSAVVSNMASVVLGLRMRPEPIGGFDSPREGARPIVLRSVVDRILFLRDVALFANASTQAVTTLAETAQVVTLAEGETLFGAADAASRLYVVTAGEIEATHTAPPMVGRFGPGSVVAGPAALVEHNGGFSAKATVPSTLLAIDIDDYYDVMEEHFSVVRSAMMFMASDVDALLERQATGAHLNVR
jgi:CRP-like cAMP-binding protein